MGTFRGARQSLKLIQPTLKTSLAKTIGNRVKRLKAMPHLPDQ
jgi:hypothetical protein